MLAIALSTFLSAVSPTTHTFPLASSNGLEVIYGVTVESGKYRGRRCVTLVEELDPLFGGMAVIPGLDFNNGTIEFDAAGLLTENAPRGARSFVGIAFRGTDDMQKYENFYMRMTNGRSTDPNLRKHAVQYCMVPDYPWDLLRKQKPGQYEAYTDLELGAWTHVKVAVSGTEAKFFVGNMSRPALVVPHLFRGNAHGKLALWVDGYTRAYFANLVVRGS